MKSKWILFAGIAMLIAGIIIRKTTGLANEGLFMILTGVSLKTFYIIRKARRGEYVPGKELIFLFAGLGLFLTGLYLKAPDGFAYAPAMIISGISLKVIFIILFILKTRKVQAQNLKSK